MRKINIGFDSLEGQELYGIRDESLKVTSGKDDVDYIDVEVKEPYSCCKLLLKSWIYFRFPAGAGAEGGLARAREAAG